MRDRIEALQRVMDDAVRFPLLNCAILVRQIPEVELFVLGSVVVRGQPFCFPPLREPREADRISHSDIAPCVERTFCRILLFEFIEDTDRLLLDDVIDVVVPGTNDLAEEAQQQIGESIPRFLVSGEDLLAEHFLLLRAEKAKMHRE